jgi:RNA polymerase sigma-70 factor (ECF subfamily)
MSPVTAAADFDEFVTRHDRGLRRALAGHLAVDDVADALAEALAYAWQHWERVATMDNPTGYLFRVAQSRSRRRKWPRVQLPEAVELPDVEPRLMSALHQLPTMQRSAVWLVHACDWSYAEAAEALGISASAVGTHLSRAMPKLRAALGVTP